MGTSLWIVPTELDAKRIATLMHLRPQHADYELTPSSYPHFHPHITLASLPSSMSEDLQLIERALPQRDSPLTCSFDSVKVGASAYYRSVYVTIKTDIDLLDLHKRVHENLKIEPTTPEFPHLSLVYVDDGDAQKGERQKYFDLLKKVGKFEEQDGGTKLKIGADGEDAICMSGFEAKEIWLVRCEGPVEGWQILAKYNLVKQD